MSEKKYIILDLFVINAITSNDSDLYFRTGALLQLIKDKCHKIVLSPALKKEYTLRLKILKREGYTNDRLFKYIKRLLVNSEKVREVPDLAYDIPVGVPEKDQPIVKTALARKGNTIIITTNRKHLINNVKLQEFLKEHGIMILSLDKALTEVAKD